MKTEPSIKYFTRGGQTFLHNFRMVNQIINRVAICCLVVFIMTTLCFVYAITSEYQRYIMIQWGWANVLAILNDTTKLAFINPDGSIVKVLPNEILNAALIKTILQDVYYAGAKAIMGAFSVTALCFIALYRYLRKRGEQQTETRQIRGDEIADIKTIKKLIIKSKNISDISIAGISMPANFEVRHVMVHGTIGSGKSVLIKELLDQIRKRGEKALIYDKGCDYVKDYFHEETDIILNPLDKRTASWHLWNECRDFADYDSMAAALIPMPGGASDPFWVSAARTIFAAAARQMQNEPDRSIEKLLQKLLTADVPIMENYLKGTEAETLVSGKMEKTSISIKAVLATSLKSLRYVKDERNPFSVRDWIKDDKAKNWVFVSSLADKHETLKPLITLWLDIAVNAIMSLSPSQTRRIWIILDELPTLNKLPYLINALAEARKFGGCLVAGIQSIYQLRDTYGHNGAEGISGLCNSKWFFRSPSFDTANWVSRELGQAEIEEVKEGVSYGESTMRSGISISTHQTNRQIICLSDIMRLPDLSAYVRLIGGYPITQVKLEYQQRKERAPHFIARVINMCAMNEVEQWIKNAEGQTGVLSEQPEYKEQEVLLEW